MLVGAESLQQTILSLDFRLLTCSAVVHVCTCGRVFHGVVHVTNRGAHSDVEASQAYCCLGIIRKAFDTLHLRKKKKVLEMVRIRLRKCSTKFHDHTRCMFRILQEHLLLAVLACHNIA